MSMSVPGNSCRPCSTSNTVTSGCLMRLSGQCVYYSGAPISGPGINTGDVLNVVINKLANSVSPLIAEAENGLSATTNKVVLGQDLDQSGNPAMFTSHRQIPTQGFNLLVTGTGKMSLGHSTTSTPNTTLDIYGTFSVGAESLGFPIQGFQSNLPGTAYISHGANNWGFVIARADNTISAPNLTFYKTQGNDLAVRVPVSPGVTMGRIGFQGVTSTLSVSLASSIVCQVATVGAGFITSNIQFIQTTTIGAPYVAMLLTGEGNLELLGNMIIGSSSATPTAKLHILAGTAAAGTAPLKLTAGTNLTTPENGAFEFDGTHLYITIGGIRYQLDQQAGAFTIMPLTSADFDPDGITVTDPSLNGRTYEIFLNDLNRFIYNEVGNQEWDYVIGGGFQIMIPGFDASSADYHLYLYPKT